MLPPRNICRTCTCPDTSQVTPSHWHMLVALSQALARLVRM